MSETKSKRIDGTPPRKALRMYLSEKRTQANYAESTLDSHESRLGMFVDWCEQTQILVMEQLDKADIHDFRLWRFEDNNLAPKTVKTQLDTLRAFLRFCEKYDYVEDEVHKAADSANIELSKEHEVRTEVITPERAKAILEWHHKYEYAERRTVLFNLIYETSMRRCSVRSLDLEDFHPNDQALRLVHREDEGTPLKNNGESERWVALTDTLTELIEDYITGKRHDVTDEYGREPLIATREGRAAGSTIQSDIYEATRPPVIGKECSCEGSGCRAENKNRASKCEDSIGPHSLRRSSITHALNDGVRIQTLSDRVDCNPATMKKHYDSATKAERMERRRGVENRFDVVDDDDDRRRY